MGFENYRDFQNSATQEQHKELAEKLEEKLKNAPPKPTSRCRGNTWYIPYDTISNREKERGKHPATFPVALVEQCILFSGIQNGIVLDPFMGSGTAAVAALKNNFEYIGYDIDPEYIEFANHRISVNQTSFETLFAIED
jgi:site-specific DNA-methyltransferase (adenine-specific)